jgi:hypothetical protein
VLIIKGCAYTDQVRTTDFLSSDVKIKENSPITAAAISAFPFFVHRHVIIITSHHTLLACSSMEGLQSRVVDVIFVREKSQVEHLFGFWFALLVKTSAFLEQYYQKEYYKFICCQ